MLWNAFTTLLCKNNSVNQTWNQTCVCTMVKLYLVSLLIKWIYVICKSYLNILFAHIVTTSQVHSHLAQLPFPHGSCPFFVTNSMTSDNRIEASLWMLTHIHVRRYVNGDCTPDIPHISYLCTSVPQRWTSEMTRARQTVLVRNYVFEPIIHRGFSRASIFWNSGLP